MASADQVLSMLLPDGGWAMVGESFEGITFLECEPITKEQFINGFAAFDAFQQKREADALTAKESAQSKLTALGLTTDDLKALGL